MKRLLFNFQLATEGVMSNKLRGMLTALGVIFGVAAVIAMLAIGTGAKQSLLEQMKLIGTNNIVINPVKPEQLKEQEENNQNSNNNSEGKQKQLWTPGLTLNDARAIESILPGVSSISPEINNKGNVVYNGKYLKVNCIGTNNAYFEHNNLKLNSGSLFHQSHLEGGRPVCIIGSNVKSRLFYEENPIGQWIKFRNEWLKVIGVLERRSVSGESLQALGISDANSDIYIPAKTALLRYEDRARKILTDIGRRSNNSNDSPDNYHQLDRLVVKVNDAHYLRASADVTARLLRRLHRNTVDFEVEVPELLLQQQQKTQDTFNFVLAVIAGISLLVGGIGIMNIMLASVLERIKEIGVRRSMGATATDIQLQFLFESVILSLFGGLIGVVLGIVSAQTIAASAGIPTEVTLWSVLLSFGVAASVGLVFGLLPARRAARQDPIKALRSE
jgi:putative ABC transport system permease protein